VWVQRGRVYPTEDGTWEQHEKPGVVIMVRPLHCKYPYRVRYQQKTRPDQEAWVFPAYLRPREADQ